MNPEMVWFKRDLRVADHAPLAAAARRGPVLCVYVYEPDLITADDFSARHLQFINDSLRDLDAALRRLGTRLITQEGEAVEVLQRLHQRLGFTRIWAHQETTNGVSYARDRAVQAWAQRRGVEVFEARQNGVVRRLVSRDGWASQWRTFTAAPLAALPARCTDGSGGLDSVGFPGPEYFRLADDRLQSRQSGGQTEGARVLTSFLTERSENYRRGLSSPVTAWDSCSRLSPYLAYGNLSIRTVYQHACARRRVLQRAEGRESPQAASLESFIERLHWHCHFMQKLEDEPRIEFENMNRAFDGLRESDFNPDTFAAWAEGRTGYPMVDACMRALIATGWINFRMRAMLISFAAHHLWLHWRQPALHLARLFVDYEPGIHYSQVQMQSATTGINKLRIYSPVKQVLDQDPSGEFIRRWVPELQRVPNDHLARPECMPPELQSQCGCVIGRDYPAPIVNHESATRLARQRLQSVRLAAKSSGESDRVMQRHGSRRTAAQSARKFRGWRD